MGKEVFAFCWREASERAGDGLVEGFDRSSPCLAQQGLQFGEELFDRIEVGAVWRQITQVGTGGLDGFADALDLVAGQIVHHDNVALPQRRDQELLHPSEECLAVDRAVDDAWRRHAVLAQGSNEGDCFPVTVRDCANQPLATRTTAVKPGHLGGRAAFVDKDQALRFHISLTGAPFQARLGDIGPILFRGSQ